MGNWISKFRRRFCRRRCHRPLPSGRRPVVSPVHCEDASPGRDHPAAPAPVVRPGHRPSHRDRAPVASGFYIAPRRWCPLPQTARFPVGILPSVNWKDPPKKPVLSARNSRMFGPSRTVHIPPARRRFSLLPPPPEQGVAAEKPGPSGTTPRPCPKEAEVTVQAGSPAWLEKDRDSLVRPNQQNAQNSPDKSGDLPLTPRSLKTEGVLRPCRPSTEEVLGEDPPPSAPASPTPGTETDGEEPVRPSARGRPRKRKRSEPLLPPPPQLCDPGELPPPPRLPRLAWDQNRGTLQSKKTLEDKTEGTADSSATRPAPAVSAPGSAMAGTLPPAATEAGRRSATTSAGAAADLSAQPEFRGAEDIRKDTTPPGFGATVIPSDDDDIEMDTTPPCYAATVLSSPDCDARFLPVYQIQYSVEHRRPAVAPPARPH